MKPALSIAILLAFCGFAHGQSGRVQPTPTPEESLKVVTEEIKLNVLAFDNDGKFFRDVTANDVVISENNVLHQPTSVRRIPAGHLGPRVRPGRPEADGRGEVRAVEPARDRRERDQHAGEDGEAPAVHGLASLAPRGEP